MNFTVLNWNIGGAKVLDQKTKTKREETRTKINNALNTILNDRSYCPQPDVVTLQEIVQYKEPSDKKIIDLLDPIPGYSYYPFPLIDSNILSSKAKWNKVKKDSDWHHDSYFAQGNAFLVRDDAPHFPVWDLSNIDQMRPGSDGDHFIEQVHLDSGLYFGDRNTEPRAASVAHFIYNPNPTSKESSQKPLDVFVINLHLTTLMMEREGVPEIDALASKIRMEQLNVVFNGIVSRYNSWRQGGYRDRNEKREALPHETLERHSPVWIIAGDFNFTEESAEFEHVTRMNFIDTVPAKISRFGNGTKAKGFNDPTITLDYVFAGPKFLSLDPAIDAEFLTNRVIHDHEIRASDHYPVLSSINLMHT